MLRPYPTLLTLPGTWPYMLFLSPSTGSGQALAHSFALRLPCLRQAASDSLSQKRPRCKLGISDLPLANTSANISNH
jgi:hypothetical protein